MNKIIILIFGAIYIAGFIIIFIYAKKHAHKNLKNTNAGHVQAIKFLSLLSFWAIICIGIEYCYSGILNLNIPFPIGPVIIFISLGFILIYRIANKIK